jgi:hypothetical protein
LWSGRKLSGINTLLLLNTDITNTVTVGSDLQSLVVPIAPNGSLSVDPESNWYVVGLVAGNSPLVVVPNGQSNFLGLTQGLGNLAIPQVQSPNFVTGVSGWIIRKDGSAEFNSVVIRGGIVVGGTQFNYSTSTPQANTLRYSQSSGGGQDSAGNWYLPGNVVYAFDTIDGSGYIAIQEFGGIIQFQFAPTMQGAVSPWTNTFAAITWNNALGMIVQSGAGPITLNGNPMKIESGGPVTIASGTGADINITPGSGGGIVSLNADTLIQGAIAAIAQASPPPFPGNSVFYSDTLGALGTIDGTDGVAYKAQQITLPLAADTAALVALTAVLSTPCGVRTYQISGQFYINVAIANAQLALEIAVPAGATGQIGFDISRGGVFIGSLVAGINVPAGIAINLAAANGYLVRFNGLVHITASGTLNLKAGSLTAQAVVMAKDSYLNVVPN